MTILRISPLRMIGSVYSIWLRRAVSNDPCKYVRCLVLTQELMSQAEATKIAPDDKNLLTGILMVRILLVKLFLSGYYRIGFVNDGDQGVTDAFDDHLDFVI